MTSLIVFKVLCDVLSADHLAKSVSLIMKNRPHKKMLNNKGPGMGSLWYTCGTPNKIPSKRLYDKSTFVVCFCLLSNYESASMPQCQIHKHKI